MLSSTHVSRWAAGCPLIRSVLVSGPGSKFTIAVGVVVWAGLHQNRFTTNGTRCSSESRQGYWKSESTPLCMNLVHQ